MKCSYCNGTGKLNKKQTSIKFDDNGVHEVSNHIIAARLIREAATRVLDTGRELSKESRHGPWCSDKELYEMFREDAADLREVAKHTRAKLFKKAYTKLWDMDTAARDECPLAAYEFIERFANFSLREGNDYGE